MAESRDPRSEQQPAAGWNQPCLEEHLADIATSIIKWREISPFLGLTESEEHEILGAIPPSFCTRTEDCDAETVEEEERKGRHL